MQVQKCRDSKWCSMHRLRAFIRENSAEISTSDFMGYLKGESTKMIYDRHPELQSKWDNVFWARGYNVATIGKVTEEAIKRYIEEQSEESKRQYAPSSF